MDKFSSANGVVQRAVQAKKMIDGRGGGGKNRGVNGMISGRGGVSNRREKSRLGNLREQSRLGSSQEVVMMRMGNWVDQDTASVAYDNESSYDSRANHRDRGRRRSCSRMSGGRSRSRMRESRSRSRGRYKETPSVYEEEEEEDVYYDDGYDGHDGHDGQDRNHKGGVPRESIMADE